MGAGEAGVAEEVGGGNNLGEAERGGFGGGGCVEGKRRLGLGGREVGLGTRGG